MKVWEFVQRLQKEDQDAELIFGTGNLTYNRVKDRTGVVQIEFNEIYEVLPMPPVL